MPDDEMQKVVVPSGMCTIDRRHVGISALVLWVITACQLLPSKPQPPLDVTYATSPTAHSRDSVNRSSRPIHDEGGLIVLDSASLRPFLAWTGAPGIGSMEKDSLWYSVKRERTTMISTYQGSRYHPETIRAITGDSLVLASTARTIALAAARDGDGSNMILDFLGGTPDDLPGLVEMTRALAEVARQLKMVPLGIVVPAGDTVSYPTAVLARIADLLVVRLNGDHRDGTTPGPLAGPEYIARSIGMRAGVLGPNRIAAELPLYGYLWDRAGAARHVTFADARALVASESGVFRRDQASQFLTATGRDGWAVWVPDARTVEAMITAVRRRGVTHIVLSGTRESDPAIPARVIAIRR